jgi:hypothetical protein
MANGHRDGSVALRRLADVLWYVPETLLFVPADLLTVRIRDTVIPRALKRRLPFLSCRRYRSFSGPPTCGPASKYEHKGVFKTVICGHHGDGSGHCRHPRLRGGGRS